MVIKFEGGGKNKHVFLTLLMLNILFLWEIINIILMEKLSRSRHLKKKILPPRPVAGGTKPGSLASDGLPFIFPHSSALDCWKLSLVPQAKSALQHLWEEQDCLSDVGPGDGIPAACSLSGLALPLLRLALDD